MKIFSIVVLLCLAACGGSGGGSGSGTTVVGEGNNVQKDQTAATKSTAQIIVHSKEGDKTLDFGDKK